MGRTSGMVVVLIFLLNPKLSSVIHFILVGMHLLSSNIEKSPPYFVECCSILALISRCSCRYSSLSSHNSSTRSPNSSTHIDHQSQTNNANISKLRQYACRNISNSLWIADRGSMRDGLTPSGIGGCRFDSPSVFGLKWHNLLFSLIFRLWGKRCFL